MRMLTAAAFAVVFAVAGCEEHASKLDDLHEASGGSWSESQAWVAIEERALPMSIRNDLLQTATAIPDRGSLAQRADALVAWMDAGGSVPLATTMDAFNSQPFEFYSSRLIEVVKARPDDDRIFEAGLYAAWKLRCDGTGFLAAMLASAMNKNLASLRAVAPPFAAKYAPTDAQILRLFASEAMFARRATFEADDRESRESAAELDMWREFANAPTERVAFLAFVRRTIEAHPNAQMGRLLGQSADKMFAAVDEYQAWLGHASPATRVP